MCGTPDFSASLEVDQQKLILEPWWLTFVSQRLGQEQWRINLEPRRLNLKLQRFRMKL
jgi:hypothetical protein